LIKIKQADKAQLWREQVDSWSKSDVAQRRYCEDNNLSYSSFTYWRSKQQASKTVASKWLPIKVTVPSSTISIILPRNIRLEVAASGLVEVLPVVYHSLRSSH
jgi:hypothetical protein